MSCNFLIEIVKRIVTKPEAVRVKTIQRKGVDVFQVNVDKSDQGRVIGKGGKTAKALRVLIQAMSQIENTERCILEILD